MKTVYGNIWNFREKGFIIIPTNGSLKKNGEAVMGRGLALDAKKLFPDLPRYLGITIKEYGNFPYPYKKLKIITFPVKHEWYEKANLKLIEKSALQLMVWINSDEKLKNKKYFIPRVGCGNGKLNWEDVKPIIEKNLKIKNLYLVEEMK